MKQCLKCGERIPNRWILNNRVFNLQNRKFCINCSPFKKHNTRDIREPAKSQYINGKRIKPCPYETVRLYRERKKAKMIAYKGGKCELCGYNTCPEALHFHHRNPVDKLFEISRVPAWSFERVKPELDKCSLLCANCHSEVHAGLKELPAI